MGSIVGYMSIPGVVAGADLSAKQYHAVIWGGTGREVDPVTNANAQKPCGVLQDDPDAALQPCDVAWFGVVKVELGGTVTLGADLACNNDGEFIADDEVADGTAVDLHHMGVALAAGVDGDIIEMLLHPADRIGKE